MCGRNGYVIDISVTKNAFLSLVLQLSLNKIHPLYIHGTSAPAIDNVSETKHVLHHPLHLHQSGGKYRNHYKAISVTHEMEAMKRPLNLPTGVTLNGTGCKICGSETIACDVIFISKLAGFGPGLETVDVGDSGNLVHSWEEEPFSYSMKSITTLKPTHPVLIV